MTATERAEFLLARAKGLGGSDAASLLQRLMDAEGNPLLPDIKYGCSRALGFDKAKTKPDFEKEETGPMRLGNILEPVLCSDFARLTGRRIEAVGQQKHPNFPEMVGHVDRMQYAPEKDGPGILECKALGTRVFYEVRRSGLITDYLLQLQWYLAVTDCKWGSFVIGNRDNLALIYFDVDRDESICQTMLREAPKFWSEVGDPEKLAPRLEPDDPRCSRCIYRISCQASALMPPAEQDLIPIAEELSPLATEYVERKQMADEAEELAAETREVIMTILGDRQAVKVPYGGELRPVYYRQQEGRPAYGQAVKDMAAQYNILRDRLIQIEDLMKDPNARDVDGALQSLVTGSELIPVPSTFVKKGKPFRSLLLQYLAPKPKDDE